jgi:hypothetical protein
MKRTKVFLDTEFTGLHKNTTLISIGLVSGEKTFYAEFTDYDEKQVGSWLKENVIDKLELNENEHGLKADSCEGDSWLFKGKSKHIAILLKKWLEKFEAVEIWSDCLAYDWVLFCELFGGAMNIPKNVFYIPFDICTLFLMKGIDPDISRESFVKPIGEVNKHNALYDALIIESCYLKLNSL